MQRQRIYSVKNNSLNDADRLEIAKFLVKAGYSVRLGKEVIPGKKQNRLFIEFWEESDE